MKLACIVENLRTYGGTQLQCIRVAENLTELGHEVQIVTTSFDTGCSHGIENRIRVSVVSAEPPHRMRDFAAKIGRVIQDADWLLVFDWDVYRLKRFIPQKRVCWICNDPPYWKGYMGEANLAKRIRHEVLRRYGLRKERHYIRRLDDIIVLDQKNKEFLRRYYGVNSVVVRSGIDLDSSRQFEADEIVTQQILDRYHLERGKYVLTIGIAFPHRNFEVLINAMQYVHSALDVIVVAPGTFDKEYVSKLKTMASHDARIQIIDRFIPEEEKRILFRNSLCFVFPNKNQTWGLAPLESLVYNTIPIVSRECGVTEVLVDNEFALVFNPDDHAELAERIVFVENNPEIRARIISSGSSFVKRNLTWHNYVTNILQVLDEREFQRGNMRTSS